ncbi:MAG: Na+/H+ antiporter NhaA [Gemmatimonadaceae bacterium]
MTTPIKQSLAKLRRPFDEFVRAEASGGIVLFVCALAAMVWANSPAADSYHHVWERTITIGLRPWALTLSLHEWINDALMAVFFFVVGLEIKREVLVGELASVRGAALPIVGALGGMIVPALVFWSITRGTNAAAGWGIPMATDIAFALGVVTLLGPYVPPGLKVFLAALAIVDDIGAVLVIALFYTAKINTLALGAAAVLMLVLVAFNRFNVNRALPYVVIGILLWLAVFNSGLHATIAGVLLAFTIPASVGKRQTQPISSATHAASPRPDTSAFDQGHSLLARFEQALHRLVAFTIMPLFALANAGVGLQEDLGTLIKQPVVAAVVGGLLIGKPLGIAVFSWIAVRTNIAQLPALSNWRQLIGVAALGGIGFTMSLFIGGLAYGASIELTEAKIGVLGGSVLAGMLGWLLLRVGAKRVNAAPAAA